MSEPTQTPTPEQTPQQKQKRPSGPSRTDSDLSADDDQGYQSRSRSQSRRRRRQGQRQRQAQGKAQAGNAKAETMAAIEEQATEEQPQETKRQKWLKMPETADTTEAQPFERIKPPSQSMTGPVTYARMMRGEIPWRGAPPTQPYETTRGVDAQPNGGKEGGDPMDQDGLKLRIELNLDIEIELKASIHGDLTLALFN